MSETPILQTIAPTPFASLLKTATKTIELVAWQSVKTPRVLDEEKKELDCLLHDVAIHDLGWLRQVAVTGADRNRWLSGMVTNAVPTADSGNYNFILSAQGRIQGDLYSWFEPDRFLLETTAAQVDRLIVHLDRYIIMDDVELTPRNEETCLGVTGPKAAELLGKLGVETASLTPLKRESAEISGINISIQTAYGILVPHFEVWLQTKDLEAVWKAFLSAGAKAVGLLSLERLRVLEGIPVFGVDFSDKDLPQESGQMRALHFSKGCYIGQEIVERVRSRGNVHRSLKQFRLEGELPGEEVELRQGETAVGQLTSAVEIPRQAEGTVRLALGIVRNEALVRKQSLEYNGGSAEPLEAPPTITL